MQFVDKGGLWLLGQVALIGAYTLAMKIPRLFPLPGMFTPPAALTWVANGVAVTGLGLGVWGRRIGQDVDPLPCQKQTPVWLPRAHSDSADTPSTAASYWPWPARRGHGAVVAGGLVSRAWRFFFGKGQAEDVHLRAAFPGYLAYEKKTRWRLVPGLL